MATVTLHFHHHDDLVGLHADVARLVAQASRQIAFWRNEARRARRGFPSWGACVADPVGPAGPACAACGPGTGPSSTATRSHVHSPSVDRAGEGPGPFGEFIRMWTTVLERGTALLLLVEGVAIRAMQRGGGDRRWRDGRGELGRLAVGATVYWTFEGRMPGIMAHLLHGVMVR
jgi:hypothetical protein